MSVKVVYSSNVEREKVLFENTYMYYSKNLVTS